MTSDPPPPAPNSEPTLPTVETPGVVELRDTQRVLAAVRVPVERRTLTVITGESAGQLFQLVREEHVLGRGEQADLRVDDPDVSRAHARFVRERDGHYCVIDASSTNGTYLGAERVERARLEPGHRIQVGPRLVLRYSVTDDIEQELLERMQASATRDHLTRLCNRRHFQERLAAELAHAHRHRVALSLLMIDVDGLRSVNDTDGQPAGDALLRAIAARLARMVRQEDVVARYGGDEFAIVARSTALPAAVTLAERLRAAVSDLGLPAVDDRVATKTTLSVGVATVSELRASAKAADLVASAERRLSRAKRLGRNRVCSED